VRYGGCLRRGCRRGRARFWGFGKVRLRRGKEDSGIWDMGNGIVEGWCGWDDEEGNGKRRKGKVRFDSDVVLPARFLLPRTEELIRVWCG
jgi:hypothetical protein